MPTATASYRVPKQLESGAYSSTETTLVTVRVVAHCQALLKNPRRACTRPAVSYDVEARMTVCKWCVKRTSPYARLVPVVTKE